MPQVEPRPSQIAGRGLFAIRPVPAGTSFPDVDRALLNHSCDPNLGWSRETLVSLRDVEDGDEITVDYATFTSDPSFSMFCHCETYRCRQVIEGGDWRIPQLQQRYAGRWHPDVQRLLDSL